MKTFTARKIVAIFTAVSLAFLQAVPAGFAEGDTNTPVIPFDGTGVPAQPSTSVTDQTITPAVQTPADNQSLGDVSPLQPLDIQANTQEPEKGPQPESLVPDINSTTTKAITALPTYTSVAELCNGTVSPTSGVCSPTNPIVSNFSQTTDAASFDYDLTKNTGGASTRWAGALFAFAGPGYPYAITSTNSLVISVTDTGSSNYKLNLIDISGKTVTIRVTVDGRIEVTRAKVDEAGVTGFDATKIKYMSIVIDEAAATTGHVSIATKLNRFSSWISSLYYDSLQTGWRIVYRTGMRGWYAVQRAPGVMGPYASLGSPVTRATTTTFDYYYVDKTSGATAGSYYRIVCTSGCSSGMAPESSGLELNGMVEPNGAEELSGAVEPQNESSELGDSGFEGHYVRVFLDGSSQRKRFLVQATTNIADQLTGTYFDVTTFETDPQDPQQIQTIEWEFFDQTSEARAYRVIDITDAMMNLTVSTRTDGIQDLRITNNLQNSATVTWNEQGVEKIYTGTFVQANARGTLEISIPATEGVPARELTLNFSKLAQWSLDGLTDRVESENGDVNETAYTFVNNVLKTRVDQFTHVGDDYQEHTLRTRTYLAFSGLAELKVTSDINAINFSAGGYSYEYLNKIYNNYDAAGNQTVNVNVSRSSSNLEEESVTASYERTDTVNKRRIYASVSDVDLTDQITQYQDYILIDQNATTRRLSSFSETSLDWSTYLYSVEEVSNGGNYVPGAFRFFAGDFKKALTVTALRGALLDGIYLGRTPVVPATTPVTYWYWDNHALDGCRSGSGCNEAGWATALNSVLPTLLPAWFYQSIKDSTVAWPALGAFDSTAQGLLQSAIDGAIFNDPANHEEDLARLNRRILEVVFSSTVENRLALEPRKITKADGTSYIVQGQPDSSITGLPVYDPEDPADIKINDWQEVSGYTVHYGPAYNYDAISGKMTYLSYGVVFTQEDPFRDMPRVVAVVDYPAQQTVWLDDCYFSIAIDADGVLTLQPQMTSEVTAFAATLQSQLNALQPNTFTVSTPILQADGTSDIMVHSSGMTSRGKFGLMIFNVNGKGAVQPDSITALYYEFIGAGPVSLVDGSVLFKALQQSPVSANDMQALVDMAKLTVTSVDTDKTMHFTLGSTPYKAYREGESVLLIDETQLIRVMPALVKFYGEGNVPKNIRAEVNPKNAANVNVFIFELQNGAMVDVMNIEINIYPKGTVVSWVRDMKTHTAAGFWYQNDTYTQANFYRTSCDSFTCRGGSWRSQLGSYVPVSGGGTVNVTSITPAFWVWSDPAPVSFTTLADLVQKATDIDAVLAGAASVLASVKNSLGNLTFHFSYTPGGFKVVVTNPAAVVGELNRMEFVVAGDGTINVKTLQVIYQDTPEVDATLLFKAMGLCPEGQSCPKVFIGDIEKLEKMPKVTVLKVDDAIHYKLGNNYYKAYWDGTEAKLDDLNALAQPALAEYFGQGSVPKDLDIQYDPATGIMLATTSDQTIRIQLMRMIRERYFVTRVEVLTTGRRSDFQYWTDGTSAGLNGISRSDSFGILSSIKMLGVDTAKVVLLSGEEIPVQFSTYRDLLAQAAAVEVRPAKVQALLEQLAPQLGEGLSLKAIPLAGGIFRIRVRSSHATDPQGTFWQLDFKVDINGVLVANSVLAAYRQFAIVATDGTIVRSDTQGELLFAAMQQQPIAAGNDQEAFIAMTKLAVLSVENPRTTSEVIHFQLGNNYYKAFYENGTTPKLEEEPSPEVWAVVADLQEKLDALTPGEFYVYPTPVGDGIFEIGVYEQIAPSTGKIGVMAFNVDTEGVLQQGSIQTFYFGFFSEGAVSQVNGNMLFAAMGSCLTGQQTCLEQTLSDIEKLAKMAQLTVRDVETNGTIHYTLADSDGILRNYKAFWDTMDNVVRRELEEVVMMTASLKDESIQSGLIFVPLLSVIRNSNFGSGSNYWNDNGASGEVTTMDDGKFIYGRFSPRERFDGLEFLSQNTRTDSAEARMFYKVSVKIRVPEYNEGATLTVRALDNSFSDLGSILDVEIPVTNDTWQTIVFITSITPDGTTALQFEFFCPVGSQIDLTDIAVQKLDNSMDPFVRSVDTNGDGEQDLAIDVASNGIATITWVDEWNNEQTFYGLFEDDQIVLTTQTGDFTRTLTFSMGELDYPGSGEFFLSHLTDHGEDSVTGFSYTDDYSFWVEERTMGEQLMSKITEQSMFGELQYRSKTYYNYDYWGESGITQIAGWVSATWGANFSYSASYVEFDFTNKKVTAAYAGNNLIDQINSYGDRDLINPYARTRSVSYFSEPHWSNETLLFIVGEVWQQNVWVPRCYSQLELDGSAWKTYIVQGEPDVLDRPAEDPSDILFDKGQQVNGYTVFYGEAQDPGHSYGLRFTKLVNGTRINVVVDFPRVKTVVLDGITYYIEIDGNGKVMLQPMSDFVLAFLRELELQLGSQFEINIKILRYPNGEQNRPPFQITITDTQEYEVPPTRGLKQVSFSLTDAGGVDCDASYCNGSHLTATYYGPAGDIVVGSGYGWALFQAIKLLQPYALQADNVGLLKQIQVVSVYDEPSIAIIFTFNGITYKFGYFDSDPYWYLVPVLQAPAMAFPTVRKHYTAQGTLLREITVDATGKIVNISMPDRTLSRELPSKVTVYQQGSADPHSEIYYDAQGNVKEVVYFQNQTLTCPAGASLCDSTWKQTLVTTYQDWMLSIKKSEVMKWSKAGEVTSYVQDYGADKNPNTSDDRYIKQLNWTTDLAELGTSALGKKPLELWVRENGFSENPANILESHTIQLEYSAGITRVKAEEVKNGIATHVYTYHIQTIDNSVKNELVSVAQYEAIDIIQNSNFANEAMDWQDDGANGNVEAQQKGTFWWGRWVPQNRGNREEFLVQNTLAGTAQAGRLYKVRMKIRVPEFSAGIIFNVQALGNLLGYLDMILVAEIPPTRDGEWQTFEFTTSLTPDGTSALRFEFFCPVGNQIELTDIAVSQSVESFGQDVKKIMTYNGAFNTGQTLTNTAWQLDMGNMVRIKSEKIVDGTATGVYSYQEKRKLSSTVPADLSVQSELGAMSTDNIVEITTSDKAFTDTSRKLIAHVWQCDMGSGMIRSKVEAVVNGTATGTYTYYEQTPDNAQKGELLGNLIGNDDFAQNTSGWTTMDSTLTRVSDVSGTYGHVIPNASYGRIYYTIGNLEAGSTYKVSFRYRTNATNLWQMHVALDTNPWNAWKPVPLAISTGWQQCELEFTPTSATGNLLYLSVESGLGLWADYTDIVVTKLTVQDTVKVQAYDKAFNDATRKLLSRVWQLDVGHNVTRSKSEKVENGTATGTYTYSEQRLDNSQKTELGASLSQEVVEVKTYDKAFNDITRKLIVHVWQLDMGNSVTRTKLEKTVNGVITYTYTEQTLKLGTDLDFSGVPLATSLNTSDAGFSGQDIYYVRSWRESFSAGIRTLFSEVFQVQSADKKVTRSISKNSMTGGLIIKSQVDYTGIVLGAGGRIESGTLVSTIQRADGTTKSVSAATYAAGKMTISNTANYAVDGTTMIGRVLANYSGIAFNDETGEIESGTLSNTTTRADGTTKSESSVTYAAGKMTRSVSTNCAADGTTVTGFSDVNYTSIVFDAQGKILGGTLTTATRRVGGTTKSVSSVTYVAGKMTASSSTNYAADGTTVTTTLSGSYSGIVLDEQGKIVSGTLTSTTKRSNGTKKSMSTVTYADGKMTVSTTTNYAAGGTQRTSTSNVNYSGITFGEDGEILSGTLVCVTKRISMAMTKSVATVTYANGRMMTSDSTNYGTDGTTVVSYMSEQYNSLVFDADTGAILSGTLMSVTKRANGTTKSESSVTYSAGKMMASSSSNYSETDGGGSAGTLFETSGVDYTGITFDDETGKILSGTLTSVTMTVKARTKSVSTVTYAGGKMTSSSSINYSVNNGTTVIGYSDVDYAGITFDENGAILSGTLVNTKKRPNGATESVSTVTYANGKMTASVSLLLNIDYSGITSWDEDGLPLNGTLTSTKKRADGTTESVSTVTYSNAIDPFGAVTTTTTTTFPTTGTGTITRMDYTGILIWDDGDGNDRLFNGVLTSATMHANGKTKSTSSITYEAGVMTASTTTNYGELDYPQTGVTVVSIEEIDYTAAGNTFDAKGQILTGSVTNTKRRADGTKISVADAYYENGKMQFSYTTNYLEDGTTVHWISIDDYTRVWFSSETGEVLSGTLTSTTYRANGTKESTLTRNFGYWWSGYGISYDKDGVTAISHTHFYADSLGRIHAAYTDDPGDTPSKRIENWFYYAAQPEDGRWRLTGIERDPYGGAYFTHITFNSNGWAGIFTPGRPELYVPYDSVESVLLLAELNEGYITPRTAIGDIMMTNMRDKINMPLQSLGFARNLLTLRPQIPVVPIQRISPLPQIQTFGFINEINQNLRPFVPSVPSNRVYEAISPFVIWSVAGLLELDWIKYMPYPEAWLSLITGTGEEVPAGGRNYAEP